MDEWMDEGMHKWMKGWMNQWTNQWMNQWMDGWKCNLVVKSCRLRPENGVKWRWTGRGAVLPPCRLHVPQWIIAKSWVGGAYWQSMSSGLGGHFEHFWGSRCIIWDDFDVIWGIFDVSIWMTLARVQKDMFCPNRFQWCHATLRSN